MAATPRPSLHLLFLAFSILSLLSLFFFFLFPPSSPPDSLYSHTTSASPSINVYVAPLPRSLNYGLLDLYWAQSDDTRLGADADSRLRASILGGAARAAEFLPYPENPIVKQYSAEYWILGDLVTPTGLRRSSFARVVGDYREADVVFVPFFATLSAEMQLGMDKGRFRKREGNMDYHRQRRVVDFLKQTEAWKRSGGRDHVFVLTDPVAMWHVRAEIAPAVLLVVDFGGWYRVDSKASEGGNSSNMIQHTQVSLLKDVIVPYTHLLTRLLLSDDQHRKTLLYFKGAKHRHRGGLVREKLWDLLVDEPGVVIEEGFPNATGREQSMKGMRSSEFCLHPAGDTPTSCRLFDAIQSLCIPVIISDSIELPFEGIIDYQDFSVFVSINNALQPHWLLDFLRDISEQQKDKFRQNMAKIQSIFEYENGYTGGVGPIPVDGAVNHIWRKVYQKLPMIKEAITREKRKPEGRLILPFKLSRQSCRAEVDTSRPFQSVKEAVAVFGDRILAGEVHANKSSNITPTAMKSQQSSSGSFSSFDSSSSHLKQEEDQVMLQASIKRLETELIETRRELKLLKDRESQMEIAVASLNAELHKSMSRLAAAEASMVAAGRTSSIKSGLALYGEQEEIVEEEKVGDKVGRLEHSQCLAELLSLGERKGYYATLEQKKKMVKKKPIVPLISDLWRKKSPVSYYSYLYSCPSFLS